MIKKQDTSAMKSKKPNMGWGGGGGGGGGGGEKKRGGVRPNLTFW